MGARRLGARAVGTDVTVGRDMPDVEQLAIYTFLF